MINDRIIHPSPGYPTKRSRRRYTAILVAAALAGTSLLISPVNAQPVKPAASSLPMKQCRWGLVPDSGEAAVSGFWGDGTTVTVTNTGLTALGVVGSIDIGNQTLPFVLLPTGSKTYNLPPPAGLISQLPQFNGFAIHVDSDAFLVSYTVKSTMCDSDEYVWNSGVTVNSQFQSTAKEPVSGTASAGIFINMGRPVTHPVSFSYHTTPGTATAGKDYTSTSGTLTLNVGEKQKILYVPILADQLTEGTETFTVNLTATTTNVVNPQVTVPVQITDTPPVKSPPPPPPKNKPPVAAFGWTRKPGPGNLIAFNGHPSTDPDGTIVAWRWIIGSTVIATGVAPTTAVGSGTTKTVSLSVTDNAGATASVTKTLSLPDRAPTVLTVQPAAGGLAGSTTPTLSATAGDDDGDVVTLNYHLVGPSVDLSSGWVTGPWTVPAHRLDPGSTYQMTVTAKDPTGLTGSRTTSFHVAMLPTAANIISTSTGSGYWQVDTYGTVFAYGDAPNLGSLASVGVHVTDIMGMARTPTNAGYWLVGRDGGVFAFGDAPFYGSLPGLNINITNIVGMAPTQTGHGYWLVGSDGGVFAFGDAGFYGSMGGQHLNAPVNSIAPTSTGHGYWLAAADGGIFAFGDAPFYGSMGGQNLNAPVVDMVATPDGGGYWMTAEDGGVFAFGDAGFYGSMAGQPLNGHITGISATPNGHGYWLNACDGGIFAFGNAQFRGSNPTYECRGT